MTSLSAFMEHVLPEQSGSIAIGYGVGGPASTRFVASRANLLAALPRLIMSAQDLYYTPACYTVRRRKADNCAAKRCIVLDIDLNHEKKPSYHTKDEALRALLMMAARRDLPLPSYVLDSGRGLHVYWALDADVQPDLWKTVASSLRDIIVADDPKLGPDTTRWADLAGYLRVPGSMNSKSGTPCDFYKVNGVHVGSETPYALSLFMFDALVRPARATGPTVPAVPSQRTAPTRPRVRKMSAVNDQEETSEIPRPMDLIGECVPLAELAKGDQSYEAWQGLARLFARAGKAGRDAFHAVSEKYKGYDPEATDAKFDDALATSFASPSCAQMRDWAGMRPAACRACPLFQAQGEGGKPSVLQSEFIDVLQKRNLTPASLDEEVRVLARARNARLQGKFAPMATIGVTIPKRLLKAPAEDRAGIFIDKATGFMMARVEVTEGKTVTYEDRRISRRPFWIEARISERDASSVGVVFGARVVQARLRGEDWEARYVTVPAAELNAGSGTFLTALQNYGLDIDATDPRTAHFRMLHSYVRASVNAIETSRAYHKESRFGWREGDTPSFVIGDRLYSAGGETLLIEQDPGAFDMNEKVEQRGELNAAKEISARAMKHGLFPLRFLMLCALGAPLMHMTNVEGALVLVSGRTGKGKTAAMSYANSFFGSSRPGRLLANGTDTQKSIMHMIGIVSNLPAFIDETTLMKDAEMATTLLQITQGGENNRLEASSNRLRQRNRWQTIAIASANKDVTEIIKAESYTAEAQRARAIDLMTAHMEGEIFYRPGSRQFLDDVLMPSHAHHGLIGVDFIKYCLDNYAAVEDRVRKTEASLSLNGGILSAKDGDTYRVWRAVVAVALVAGSIGEKLGYWHMDKSFLDEVLHNLVQAASTLQSRASVDSSNYVRDFLYANQGAIIIDAKPIEGTDKGRTASVEVSGREVAVGRERPPSHTPSRSSVARLTLTEGSTSAICDISTMAFRRFCKDNELELSYVLAKLADDGALLSDARQQLARGAPLPSMPNTVSSVGGEALPASRAIRVKLTLTAPYVMGHPPEYL